MESQTARVILLCTRVASMWWLLSVLYNKLYPLCIPLGASGPGGGIAQAGVGEERGRNNSPLVTSMVPGTQ